MPSIPQSLLWISLVVLWLFVLVPMLISKRDAVRRTSDVALATRVLNGGAGARLLKRGGPAADIAGGTSRPKGRGTTRTGSRRKTGATTRSRTGSPTSSMTSTRTRRPTMRAVGVRLS